MYIPQVSGERLQDHWSSGYHYKPMGIFPDAQGQLTPESEVKSGQKCNSSEIVFFLVTVKNKK